MQSSGLDSVAAAARVIEIAEQFPACFVFRHTIKSSTVTRLTISECNSWRSYPALNGSTSYVEPVPLNKELDIFPLLIAQIIHHLSWLDFIPKASV
jgi:hypothetical protein